MSGNTIEAKLRIAAEVAQAITQLKALRREILETGAAGRRAAAGDATAPPATQQASATREAVRQQASADREARRQRDQADREARAAQRAADREAAELARQRRAEDRKANAERVREEQEATRRVRASVNLQAQAYRQLPAQITDITTSIASGMPVWMVAVQQGGQLRDSFGGVVPAGKALLGLLTPIRLAVGAVAGTFIALAAGAVAGYRETDRLNKALALTGNTAATSVGQLDTQARQIASNTGTSIGDVRETLEALVSAGGQTSITLDSSARAVTAYRRLTGATADEAVRLFAGQTDAVLEWSTKANKAYSFLTAAQLRYIRDLQAQGRSEEAARFANEELAKTLEQRSVPAIGLLERAWKGVGAAIGAVVDKIKQLGRPETIDDQVAALEKRVAAAARLRENMALRGQPVPPRSPEEEQLDQQLAGLRRLQAADQVRAVEAAAQRKAEQEQAVKDGKAYQDALASVDAAGVQKRLALRLAALDREQSAVELTRERELVSEQEANLRLNAIEQQRIEAQAAAVRRQIDIERGRVVEKPEDLLAKQAAVGQLEAQLIGLQSQLTQTAEKAQQLLASDARSQAAAWQRAWEDAAARIRELSAENAANAINRVVDPGARARSDANLLVAQARRELDLQRQDLTQQVNRTVDPGKAAELQRQLDQLTKEGNAAIGERQRQARLQSLRDQLDEQTEQLRLQEQAAADLVEQGAITTEEAERRKLEARAAAVPLLQRILALLRQESDAASVAEQNTVNAAAAGVATATNLGTELGKVARSSGISQLSQGLTDIETGATSAGEALRNMVGGFAKALLNVLNQRLAEQLVNSITNALKGATTGSAGSTGGGFFSAVGAFVASLFHTGGVVGGGMARMSRAMPAALLAGAQVLHGGGIAGMGLKPGEQAAVLKVGEEVLTEDNPRHIKNYRGTGVQMSNSFVFNGAGGSVQDQQAAADELAQQVNIAVERWAAKHQRQGGILAGARRG